MVGNLISVASRTPFIHTNFGRGGSAAGGADRAGAAVALGTECAVLTADTADRLLGASRAVVVALGAGRDEVGLRCTWTCRS